MASGSVAMILGQSFCVQIPFWPLRWFRGCRLGGSRSLDQLLPNDNLRFRGLEIAAWITGFLTGVWLIRTTLWGSPDSFPVFTIVCGGNVLIGWFAIGSVFASRRTFCWLGIAIVAVPIVAMAESHLFGCFRHKLVPRTGASITVGFSK